MPPLPLFSLVLFVSWFAAPGGGTGGGSKTGVDGCPYRCVCKWKGGKETVECVNASLSALPPSLDRHTQVLDLSWNFLPHLPTEIFRKRQLPNLQKIFLSHSSVRTVEEHCFRGLTNLIELDLSYNALSLVPSFAATDCKYLMRLSLRGNPIASVSSGDFAHVRDLISLDLGECGLENLARDALVILEKLEFLRLESNRITTLDPLQSFPPALRELTLHGNWWHCDCHLLSLHRWLENFSIPSSSEPKCYSPPRVMGESVAAIPEGEFACIPEVTPTSSYLEVIEGKNISLICTVKAIPSARVTWRYRDTYINNGSTLIDDIDLRHYFHVEKELLPRDHSGHGGGIRSELFLSGGASVEDNGTFACVAENKAGKARGSFTLHVVVPMPPKPPQDVVEERFDFDYLVALLVAGSLVGLLAFVALALVVIRCKRSRQKRSLEGKQRMIRTRSGGDLSCTDSESTQMTASAATSGQLQPPFSYGRTSTSTSQNSFIDLTSAEAEVAAATGGSSQRLSMELDLRKQQPTDDSDTNSGGDQESYHESTLRKLGHHHLLPLKRPQPPPFEPAAVALSPPTPFADSFLRDESTVKAARAAANRTQEARVKHSNTIKRQPPPSRHPDHSRGSKTLPRKSTSSRKPDDAIKSILPPPPQYKGVHFAPGVAEDGADDKSLPIPTEGLPTRPAGSSGGVSGGGGGGGGSGAGGSGNGSGGSSSSNAGTSNNNNSNSVIVVIPNTAETVPITVRKTPPPEIKPKIKTSSSMTFAKKSDIGGGGGGGREAAAAAAVAVASAPPPPPPPSRPLQKGSEEVAFESPDEGFNEPPRPLLL